MPHPNTFPLGGRGIAEGKTDEGNGHFVLLLISQRLVPRTLTASPRGKPWLRRSCDYPRRAGACSRRNLTELSRTESTHPAIVRPVILSKRSAPKDLRI